MGAPRVVAPQTFGSRSVYGSRSIPYGAPRIYAQRRGGGVIGHAVPRSGGRYVVPGRGYYPYYPSYRYGYRPLRFYSPYYYFRPRLSIGFGFWAGFPIAYPYDWGYYYPYYYGYPYPVYSYPYPYPAYSYPYAGSYPAYPASGSPAYPPPSGSVSAQPGQTNMGGVSFEVTPSNAEIFVDGNYVGTVGEFTPTSQPLGLEAGRHHIEIRAAGYRTMAFDMDVVAGQVIPYRGALQQ
jgi:hypothetical protein